MTPFQGVKSEYSQLTDYRSPLKPKNIWRIFLGVLHRYAMGQWGVWLVQGLWAPGSRENGPTHDRLSLVDVWPKPLYRCALLYLEAT
jgi:hypothetical protein